MSVRLFNRVRKHLLRGHVLSGAEYEVSTTRAGSVFTHILRETKIDDLDPGGRSKRPNQEKVPWFDVAMHDARVVGRSKPASDLAYEHEHEIVARLQLPFEVVRERLALKCFHNQVRRVLLRFPDANHLCNSWMIQAND